MEKDPKPFVVYWMSQFASKNPGYSTPKFQPNMLTFETHAQAEAIYKKLKILASEKGTYRGRIVLHVSEIGCSIEPPAHRSATYADVKAAIGKIVKAPHPITCLNPDEWFEVVDARLVDGRVKVIGERTCWFSLDQCEVK